MDLDTDQLARLLSTLEVAHKRIDTTPAGTGLGGASNRGWVAMRISLQTPDQWSNGYVENSPACWFGFKPKGDGRVVIECFTRYCGRMPKFRKVTLPVAKVLGHLQAYIDAAVAAGGSQVSA